MKVLIAALAVFLIGCASNKPGASYVRAHPELDAETKRRIMAGEAVEGMRSEHVLASLGRPESVHRTADGAEYWNYRSALLTFKDGALVNWIDKKMLY